MDETAKASRRAAELLDQVLDQRATAAQKKELNALVSKSPGLASELAQQLRIHGLLQWESPDLRIAELPCESAEPDGLVAASLATAAARTPIPWVRYCSAAAVLLSACGIGLWILGRQGANRDSAVAEIVDDRLVAWSTATDALTADRRILPGRLDIESGLLTLRFRSGATVKLRGPASLRIKSDMLVNLDRGQATAHVPHWATGFTIETPDAEVVDLGTEFGVVARPDGKTDVVVFDGKVDVTQVTARDGGAKRLTQGEGLSISQKGGIHRIVQLRRDSGGESWSTAPLERDDSVFADIHDNLRATGGAKYYQITPGGFAEDAIAYVDRPHQWNGRDEKGLPNFLRHADYVRTFNDDKYVSEFEIVVKLAKPAWLYILFDDRVPLPSWLRDGFEDTGYEVGLDEGPWETADMTLQTAIGSGQSVDRVFSVWRKRCDGTQTLTLGGMGATPEARAMYGIAATPL